MTRVIMMVRGIPDVIPEQSYRSFLGSLHLSMADSVASVAGLGISSTEVGFGASPYDGTLGEIIIDVYLLDGSVDVDVLICDDLVKIVSLTVGDALFKYTPWNDEIQVRVHTAFASVVHEDLWHKDEVCLAELKRQRREELLDAPWDWSKRPVEDAVLLAAFDCMGVKNRRELIAPGVEAPLLVMVGAPFEGAVEHVDGDALHRLLQRDRLWMGMTEGVLKAWLNR